MPHAGIPSCGAFTGTPQPRLTPSLFSPSFSDDSDNAHPSIRPLTILTLKALDDIHCIHEATRKSHCSTRQLSLRLTLLHESSMSKDGETPPGFEYCGRYKSRYNCLSPSYILFTRPYPNLQFDTIQCQATRTKPPVGTDDSCCKRPLMGTSPCESWLVVYDSCVRILLMPNYRADIPPDELIEQCGEGSAVSQFDMYFQGKLREVEEGHAFLPTQAEVENDWTAVMGQRKWGPLPDRATCETNVQSGTSY